MNLSLNWIKEYIDLPSDLTPRQLAYDLTMSTVEVESITNQANSFDQMVVGEIKEVTVHPNADKLKLTKVDIGEPEPVQIVCGGSNLAVGMLVPVALPGARVRWHGEGDLITLEPAKIRGEASHGMICASSEIGLDSIKSCGETEITDLSEFRHLKTGQNLAEAFDLDDVIIEIDNKSLTNRPDLWNHYGIARELSAIYNLPLRELDLFDPQKLAKLPNTEQVTIDILDKEACPRYMGCLVRNIKIEESPDWLKKRLVATGSRPINNIVDITNYVMQDTGNPMHAFDLRDIAGHKITVTRATSTDSIQTLDNESRTLTENDLVIADTEKAVALAGIMGGANSEIKDDTADILFESANFDGMTVRRTSQRLQLRSDSSARFEKKLDPHFAETAMLRALQLIEQICPEAEIVFYADHDFSHTKDVTIELAHESITRKLGREFSEGEVLDILSRLGFETKTKNSIYHITVPSWRATGDISIPEDIIEEVARIFGYDNFEDRSEKVTFTKAKFQPEFHLENKIKQYLADSCGMHEVFNYPWTEERIVHKYNLINQNAVTISNPPAEANQHLQSTLIPNLVKNIEDNANEFATFKIFEIAKVFMAGELEHNWQDRLPHQKKHLAGAVVGPENEIFLETKGILESMGFTLTFSQSTDNLPFLGSDKHLDILANDKKIGWLGQMKDKIKKRNACFFEINFAGLVRAGETAKQYTKISEFPSVERDLSFELDKAVKWQQVKTSVNACGDIIEQVEFVSDFDLGDKKSLSFRIILGSHDHTLTDEEVEVVINKIIKKIEREFGGKLR